MLASVRVSIIIAALVLDGLSACDDRPAGGIDARLEEDAAIVDADAAIDAAVCAGGGLMMCGGQCVDTTWDPQHCGGCAATCSSAISSCAASACVAPLTTRWERHNGGDDTGNFMQAVAVDVAGNVYVAGSFRRTITLGGAPLTAAVRDVVVASFAPDGTHRWSKRFGGAQADEASGITVAGGVVYVTGTVAGPVDFGTGIKPPAGGADPFVLTLASADGTVRTAFTFGSADADVVGDIVVGPTGDITVGGAFGRSPLNLGGGHVLTGACGFNAFVASFSSAGVVRWARGLAGAADACNGVSALTVDAMGNVAVGGFFERTTDFGGGPVTAGRVGFSAAFVASYTAVGAYRWSRVFGSADEADQTTKDLAVDATGAVIAGGYFQGRVDFGSGLVTAPARTGWITILDRVTGATRLARPFPLDTSSNVIAVAADSHGNPVVVAEADQLDFGMGAVLPATYLVTVAGFDRTSGANLFAKRYGGETTRARDLALAGGDTMLVTGTFEERADLGLGFVGNGQLDHGFVMMIAR